MTAQQMADMLDISIATLTQVELGTRPMNPVLYYKMATKMGFTKEERAAILVPIRRACLNIVIEKMELPQEIASGVIKAADEYLAICQQNYRRQL